MCCEHGYDVAIHCVDGCPDMPEAIAERVVALLDAADIVAEWEYPGYIHVHLLGSGHACADLSYGLDEEWWGSPITWDCNPEDLGFVLDPLPASATSVQIAAAIVRGVTEVYEYTARLRGEVQ